MLDEGPGHIITRHSNRHIFYIEQWEETLHSIEYDRHCFTHFNHVNNLFSFSFFLYVCALCDYGICGMWYMRVLTYICTCKVRDGNMCPVRLCLNPLRHHLPWSLDPGWGTSKVQSLHPYPLPPAPSPWFSDMWDHVKLFMWALLPTEPSV